jgi:hypothetical protein
VVEGCRGQPLPSIARNDLNYTDQSYWRGRQWGPHTMLTWWGLTHNKYEGSGIVDGARHQLAKQVDGVWKNEWRQFRHVHENYDGDTADGCNTGNSDPLYSWGALNPFVATREWSIGAERRQRGQEMREGNEGAQPTHSLTRPLSLSTEAEHSSGVEVKVEAISTYSLSRSVYVRGSIDWWVGSDTVSRYYYLPSSSFSYSILDWIGVVDALTGTELPSVPYVNGSFGFGQRVDPPIPPFSPDSLPSVQFLRVDSAGRLYVVVTNFRQEGVATIHPNGTWLSYCGAYQDTDTLTFDVDRSGQRLALQPSTDALYGVVYVHSLSEGVMTPTPLYSVHYAISHRATPEWWVQSVAFDTRGQLFVLVEYGTNRTNVTTYIDRYNDDGRLVERVTVMDGGGQHRQYSGLVIGGDDDMAVMRSGFSSLCWMRLRNDSLTCSDNIVDAPGWQMGVSRGMRGERGWGVVMGGWN